MARIPDGADLVDNPISKAPGFRIGNVIVMAGVPSVMQAMLDNAMQGLRTRSDDGGRDDRGGRPARRASTATRWARSPRRGPTSSIGSYPSFADGKFRNQIVCRAKDPAASPEARAAVEAMMARCSKTTEAAMSGSSLLTAPAAPRPPRAGLLRGLALRRQKEPR